MQTNTNKSALDELLDDMYVPDNDYSQPKGKNTYAPSAAVTNTNTTSYSPSTTPTTGETKKYWL